LEDISNETKAKKKSRDTNVHQNQDFQLREENNSMRHVVVAVVVVVVVVVV
jgi:hypothetical protein